MIGTIGAVVPGLPTTLFLILAAACYIRSSQKLCDWLITNKTFGPYLKDYREVKACQKCENPCGQYDRSICRLCHYFCLEGLMLKVFVGLFGMLGVFYII